MKDDPNKTNYHDKLNSIDSHDNSSKKNSYKSKRKASKLIE